MQRQTLLVPFLGASLAVAIAACGSDSKSSQTTTPVAATEPAEPTPQAPPEPAPAAEPAPPPAPPAPSYVHGKWVWFELRSTDAEKSKAFYSELIGWQVEQQEMGGMKFELVKAAGKDIATIMQVEKGKGKSHWIPFVSVPDVDAAVKTIEEQKGVVVTPASDIPNIGRFAILADPNGAEFAVFKSSMGDAPDAEPSPGAFMWNEYQAKNKKQHEAALAFYTAALGFSTSKMEMGEGKKKTTYDMISFKDVPRGGVLIAKPASLGGQWLPWVTVEDVDAVVANVKKLKGKVVTKPHDIPSVGRAAVVADPTGAAIGILKPGGAEPAAQPASDAKPEEKPAESGGQKQ